VVMLSGETAVGAYPVEAVQMMAEIIEQVEQSDEYLSRPLPAAYGTAWESDNATARAAATLSRNAKIAALVVLAKDTHWVDLVADYRPLAPIIAVVEQVALARRLALQWGVVSHVASWPRTQQELINLAENVARQRTGATAGLDIAILAPSLPQGGGRTLTLWTIQ
jgi:pyruvate kinase